MPPRKRLPMTRSSPSRSFSTNGSRSAEVVAVVGVAHDDVAAARGGDAGLQRGAVAALGDVRRRGRRRAAAMSCEPSVLPLSATRTSPATPARSRKPRALATQTADASRASLRHGMTIVSSTDDDVPLRRPEA